MTARDAGISVVPIMFDGTKQPSIRQWRQYQQVLPSVEELARWFADARYGLAVITGKISGNLEAKEFYNSPRTIRESQTWCVQG